jgi:RNA polymerase sigma-70 factor (ECF subfamily)
MMSAGPSTGASETPHAFLTTSLSLLDGLRARNCDSWRAFVGLYAPLVVRWCHRQGLNEADVADVAQEVFSRVSQFLPRFHKEEPTDSFRGWLCRLTHNQIIDFFRTRDKTHPAQGGSDMLSWLHRQPEKVVTEPDAEDARNEEHFLFLQAVQAVRGEFSELHWRMFWRVAVEGNAAPAVAAEFGVTPAAVRQAKSRVLRRLREAVGDVSTCCPGQSQKA